jgi:hypothetical protein
VRAGRVNTLVTIITTTITAGVAHELLKERDPSAVFIGDPSSGPQVGAALALARRRLAGLDADLQAIDAPHLGLAGSLGSSARLADNR